jgi:hypothetical protein
MVQAAITAMAGSGRRPRHRRPVARDRPRPDRDLAGMARPGLGPSGSVSCLTVPLLVRARPALGSLGYRGARDLTGRPGRPRSCRHGLAGPAGWAAGPRCGQPLVPTGPQNPAQIFSNHTVLAGAPLRNRTVELLLTIGIRSAPRPGISPEGQIRGSASAQLGQVQEGSRRMRPPRFLPTGHGRGARVRPRFRPARSLFDTHC